MYYVMRENGIVGSDIVQHNAAFSVQRIFSNPLKMWRERRSCGKYARRKLRWSGIRKFKSSSFGDRIFTSLAKCRNFHHRNHWIPPKCKTACIKIKKRRSCRTCSCEYNEHKTILKTSVKHIGELNEYPKRRIYYTSPEEIRFLLLHMTIKYRFYYI